MALPSASLLENLQFNQAVIVPNAVQGLFKRRPKAVAVATRVGVDGQAVRLAIGLKHKYGPTPVWVQVMNTKALFLLDVADIRRVLEGAPSPFAADPAPKRAGMVAFQPHALTLSRGDLWRERRVFTEAVLGAAATDRIVAVAEEETDALLVEAGGTIDYEQFHRAFRRLVRRIMFGEPARDDEELSQALAGMMDEANGRPGKPSEDYPAFEERLRSYIERAHPDSLAAIVAQTQADPDVRPEGQLPHWLFAMQDTLAANTLRALALIASHPEHRGADLAAALQEAMRLWPTTPLLSRETLVELTWNGEVVPAGSQILIFNTFFHRDPERIDHADRFAPEAWTEGDAGEDWALNFFSHGPQGCPGASLSLLIGTTVLSRILERSEPVLRSGHLDPAKPLPHMLDVFAVKIGVGSPVTA